MTDWFGGLPADQIETMLKQLIGHKLLSTRSEEFREYFNKMEPKTQMKWVLDLVGTGDLTANEAIEWLGLVHTEEDNLGYEMKERMSE